MSGCGNPKSIMVDIFDSEGILVVRCNGNLKAKCKELNIPFCVILDSYKNSGKPIYTKPDLRVVKAGRDKYKNWFAIQL